jgi:hypothetical protein
VSKRGKRIHVSWIDCVLVVYNYGHGILGTRQTMAAP